MNRVWIPLLLLVMLVGCGGSSSSKGATIDMSEYLPTMLTKEYTQVAKSVNDSRMQSLEFSENISIEPNLITVKVDEEISTIKTILKDKITIQEFGDENRTITMTREVREGDKVIENIQENLLETLSLGSQVYGNKSISTKESCTLIGKVKEFSKYFYLYENYDDEHDIIKLECTTIKTEITSIEPEFEDKVNSENGTVEFKPDTSYVYLQKGIGTIATIDDDCIVEKSPEVIVDDTAKPNECIGEQYSYVLYHPEY